MLTVLEEKFATMAKFISKKLSEVAKNKNLDDYNIFCRIAMSGTCV